MSRLKSGAGMRVESHKDYVWPTNYAFKQFGFEVRLHASWIVIAALVTWSLAPGLFPAQYPGLPPASYWWMGAVGLFVSIVVQQLCHSLVAKYISSQ
jgi:hypothetical protein